MNERICSLWADMLKKEELLRDGYKKGALCLSDVMIAGFSKCKHTMKMKNELTTMNFIVGQ